MTNIFRYPGGKSKTSIRKIILQYKPDIIDEYREPFVGGGGIFFCIDPEKKRWINDVNKKLISVYLSLRDSSKEFIEKCRQIDPKSDISFLEKTFNEFKKNEDMDQSLRYFYINRTVWGGRVTFKKKLESRLYFSNPEGWKIVSTRALAEAAEILKGTIITSGDYSKLLEEDGNNVWIYIDPPYVVNTELPESSQLYEFNFTLEDHISLKNNLSKCKHKWCLSYDNHPLIIDLYKEFYIYYHSWKYCGSSLDKKDNGKEVVITNYPISVNNDLFE